MFGIGGWELVLVITIAMVVAGPERLVRWAYTMGTWTARMQRLWADTAKMLQGELDSAGVNVQLPREVPTRDSLRRQLDAWGRQTLQPLADAESEARQALDLNVPAAPPRPASPATGAVGTNGQAPKPTSPSAAPPARPYGTWSQPGDAPPTQE